MTLAYEHKKTYEDYAKLPDKPRVELIDGEFLMCPAPNMTHQRLLGHLFSSLRAWVKAHRLGEVFFAPCDVVLSPYDTVQPDILFIDKERSNIIVPKNVQGAPDFVIEILSPGNAARDQVLKRRLYEKSGVREYWIVDPDSRSVRVMRLDGDQYREEELRGSKEMLISSVVSQFQLSVGELFSGLEEK